MIYINNQKKLKEIKNKINKDNICIFLDYDETITSSDSEDSWAAIANKEVLGEELLKEMDKYYEIYRPIELDYKIDVSEKEKYMVEWYRKCMDLYYKYNLTQEKLKESIYKSKLILSKGVKDFLLELYKRNIPVIILSAGIGNVIEQCLKEEECYYSNIDIISNFIKFDENGKMIKFDDYLIHSLNKDIDKLADLKMKEKIKIKKYRIVIGDLIEDIKMMGNYEESNSLKIGFLNKNINENLEVYKKKFDIVLTGENNFYNIVELLKEV